MKEHKISYTKLPNGRYDYSDLCIDTSVKSLSNDVTKVSDILARVAALQQQVTTLQKSQQVLLQLLQFLTQINFMGPELLNQLQAIISEKKKESH